MVFEEGFISLTPINFFAISCDCFYREYEVGKGLPARFLLPSLSPLAAEEPFAQVAMAWGVEGITIEVKTLFPFQRAIYPSIERGDSIELFFDTRDLKTAGFNTRFCHHFFFLPEAVEGIQAKEITHFRTEDRYDLCAAEELSIVSKIQKNSSLMKIFIPASCLYGYDPEQFDRLGFTYRINRAAAAAQHFAVTTDDYQLEQQPSLWSSLILVR